MGTAPRTVKAAGRLSDNELVEYLTNDEFREAVDDIEDLLGVVESLGPCDKNGKPIPYKVLHPKRRGRHKIRCKLCGAFAPRMRTLAGPATIKETEKNRRECLRMGLRMCKRCCDLEVARDRRLRESAVQFCMHGGPCPDTETNGGPK